MENKRGERNVLNGENDEQEEEKMEKFFTLIRSFHDARNRRRAELIELERKNNKVRKLQSEQSSWVPRFEWEDFTEEIEFRKPPSIFPAPCSKKEDKKKEDDNEEGRKKRAGSEDEEERINTFFTLIRNIQDARNQIMFGSKELKAEGRGREMKSTWTPSFKLEDFATEAHLINNNVAMLPSCSKNECRYNQDKQEQLDLNLSL